MAENRLVGFKCEKCGTISYPRRFLCPSCKGRDFEEYPLGDEGKIVTFTKLWAIPEGIDQLPLTLAIVEFDGKVRVTGQVLSEEIKTGDKVRPVWGHIRKIREKEVQGFRFERVAADSFLSDSVTRSSLQDEPLGKSIPQGADLQGSGHSKLRV